MAHPAQRRPSVEEHRRLYEVEKLSDTQIGKRYEVGRTTARRWREEAGIPPRPRSEASALRQRRGKPVLPRPSNEELLRMYEVQNIAPMARELGRGAATVTRWLVEAGAEIRKQGARPPGLVTEAETEAADEPDTEPAPEQETITLRACPAAIETMPLHRFVARMARQYPDWQKFTAAKPDLVGQILAPIEETL